MPLPDDNPNRPLVLVVEDHPMMQRTLVEILDLDDYRSLTADDGQTALVQIARHAPDLVLLDVSLPGAMDGFDVLRAIRSNPSMAGTRVIILSVDDAAARNAAAEEADVVLQKPVDAGDLLTLIERLLGSATRGA